MKLWHDDVRPAPEGWVHARTNEEAQNYLLLGDVEECSLDHDLGYAGPLPGPCEECEGKGVKASASPGAQMLHPCPACDGDGFFGGDILYYAGIADETGLDLVKWMVENDCVPSRVTIHSWNPGGAQAMSEYIQQAIREQVITKIPRDIIVAPYTLEEWDRVTTRP